MGQERYNLSFTTASLRAEVARVVAETFLQLRDWRATTARIRGNNALQCRTAKSSELLERELRKRIQLLTAEQIAILANATTDDRTAMAWLAMMKRSEFVFAFTTEVLAPKLLARDPVLRHSDYEGFVDQKAAHHPELRALTEQSRGKIRQVLLKMLVEAGLLVKGKPIGVIQRPVLSPQVIRAIEADDPRWLLGFLVPDAEVTAR